jgi:hypothetical protein
VDRARDQLLARAGFAGDQSRRLLRDDVVQDAEDLLHRRPCRRCCHTRSALQRPRRLRQHLVLRRICATAGRFLVFSFRFELVQLRMRCLRRVTRSATWIACEAMTLKERMTSRFASAKALDEVRLSR